MSEKRKAPAEPFVDRPLKRGRLRQCTGQDMTFQWMGLLGGWYVVHRRLAVFRTEGRSDKEQRTAAVRAAGFREWGNGMWYRYLGRVTDDPSVVYESDDEGRDDGKIGVRIPVPQFARVFQRAGALEGQLIQLEEEKAALVDALTVFTAQHLSLFDTYADNKSICFTAGQARFARAAIAKAKGAAS